MGRWSERRRFSGRTSRARRLGLLVISASLIGGTLAQILIPALGWLLSLSAALVVCSGAGKKSDRLLLLLAAIGMAVGLGVAERRLESPAPIAGAGRLQRLEVEVRTVREGQWPSGNRWVQLSADVRQGARSGLQKGHRVEVLFSQSREGWRPGDRFRLVARPYAPMGLCNAGKDDRARYARRRGITALLRIKDDRAVERLPSSRSPRVRVRAAIAHAIDLAAPGPAGAVLRALVLGERQALDAQRREDWAAAGVAHLLVVSGLHLAVVFWGAQMFWGFLLHLVLPVSRSGLARVLSRLLTLVVVAAYLAVVGFSVAVLRAAVVAFLLQFHEFFGGMGRPFHFLLATAAGFLLLDPDYARAPGFQLTFVATGALMLGGGSVGLGSRSGAVRIFFAKLRRAAFFSLLVVGATAPILAHHFGEFSLAGIFTNLVAGPVLGPGVLALALPGAFFASMDFGLGHILLRFAAVLIDAIEPLILRVGHSRLGVVQTFWVGPVVCGGAVALLIWRNWRGRQLSIGVALSGGLLGVALVAAGVAGARDENALRVHFLDVGQGDAILFAGPGEGEATLVDLPGRLSPPGLATRVVAPVLDRAGLSGIRRLIASHADWDHAGGLAELWGLHPEAELAVSRGSRLPEERDRWPDAVGGRWRRLGTGDQFPAGRGAVEVLQPGDDSLGGRNDNSLVLELRYGATTVLLTGDIEESGELRLGERGDLSGATVLKVPHHGSRTSSRQGLIQKLRPTVAVAQLSLRNRFGFPHPEVVARYEALGAAWLATSVHGEIRMVSDGQLSRLQLCRRGGA
jgi:competence protein ComEC